MQRSLVQTTRWPCVFIILNINFGSYKRNLSPSVYKHIFSIYIHRINFHPCNIHWLQCVHKSIAIYYESYITRRLTVRIRPQYTQSSEMYIVFRVVSAHLLGIAATSGSVSSVQQVPGWTCWFGDLLSSFVWGNDRLHSTLLSELDVSHAMMFGRMSGRDLFFFLKVICFPCLSNQIKK